MKICFITNTVFQVGGIERVVTVLANQLCINHDVTIGVFCGKEHGGSPYQLSEAVQIEYWKRPEKKHILKAVLRRINKKTGWLKKINSGKLYDLIYFSRDQEEYWIRQINSGKYDVAVALAGKASILLGRISDRIKCKTIGWQHSSYAAYIETKGEYFWAQDYLFKTYLSRLDKNIVLNEIDAKAYERKMGVASEAVYNPKSFRSERKSPLIHKRFIAVGNLKKPKAYELLVESCKIFCAQVSDWTIDIYGEGPEKKRLIKAITKAGLSDRVLLKGYAENVLEEMLCSSGLVLSSIWEGMPMAVLEALEAGLPVIAYDISAIKPLITNEIEGIVVPCYDTQKFAEGMIELARGDDMRRQLGNNARTKSEIFEVTAIINKWEEILRSLEPGFC